MAESTSPEEIRQAEADIAELRRLPGLQAAQKATVLSAIIEATSRMQLARQIGVTAEVLVYDGVRLRQPE
jgi:hypothetical protein